MPLVSDYVNFKVSDKIFVCLSVCLFVCLSLSSICLPVRRFGQCYNFFYKNVIIVSEML